MSSSDENAEKKQKKQFRVSKVCLIPAICCIVAVGAGGYFYFKYQTVTNEKTANSKIMDQVAQSVALPDETPVFITVVDKEKLSNKQLAEKVNNGDVMLIFAKAKRLVIYRPSIAKVADMLAFSNEQDLPHK